MINFTLLNSTNARNALLAKSKSIPSFATDSAKQLENLRKWKQEKDLHWVQEFNNGTDGGKAEQYHAFQFLLECLAEHHHANVEFV